MTTKREAAYRTITEPLTLADVARELGVTVAFMRGQIKRRQLQATADGKVTGVELARYLASKRRDAAPARPGRP
jgi:hypothetical protein